MAWEIRVTSVLMRTVTTYLKNEPFNFGNILLSMMVIHNEQLCGEYSKQARTKEEYVGSNYMSLEVEAVSCIHSNHHYLSLKER